MNIQEKEINSNNVQRKWNQINEAYKENAQTILVQFTFEEQISIRNEPHYFKIVALWYWTVFYHPRMIDYKHQVENDDIMTDHLIPWILHVNVDSHEYV